MAGWANYGYCASHYRWYWGLKLYVITTPEGMPVAWCLADLKLSEYDIAEELSGQARDIGALHDTMIVLADKGLSSRREPAEPLMIGRFTVTTAAAAVVPAAPLGFVPILVTGGGETSANPECPPADRAELNGLDAEQTLDAATIVSVGQQLSVGALRDDIDHGAADDDTVTLQSSVGPRRG